MFFWAAIFLLPVAILILLITGLVFAINTARKHQKYSHLRKALACFVFIFVMFSVYSIYTAFYPSDDFYLTDFREVTSFEAPKSAQVIKKSATYPDQFGDYCSAAIIEFSESDFLSVLNRVKADPNMTSTHDTKKIIGSTALENITNSSIYSDNVDNTIYQRKAGTGNYFQIIVPIKGNKIILNRCSF